MTQNRDYQHPNEKPPMPAMNYHKDIQIDYKLPSKISDGARL